MGSLRNSRRHFWIGRPAGWKDALELGSILRPPRAYARVSLETKGHCEEAAPEGPGLRGELDEAADWFLSACSANRIHVCAMSIRMSFRC